MIIAVSYKNGQVANLSGCPEILLLTVEHGMPTSKELIARPAGTPALVAFMGLHQVDVLITREMGVASRNALEMLGVTLVPGVEGRAEEAAAKFLVGEKQGDDTVLRLFRDEDPNDPLNCLRDCSKCVGCGLVPGKKS